MASTNPIKRLFDLYTSELSFDEIERLIKNESAAVYEFFKNEIPTPEKKQNKFKRGFTFVKSLFNAFLMKLSPARRIFYLSALIIFTVGIAGDNTAYVIFAFLIVNVLIAFELADKLIVKDDIVLAKKIQKRLMPEPPYNNEYFEISAFSEAAREVGGDYFDIVKSERGDRTFIIIGDISGKGIAAALYMVRVQAILQFLIENYSDPKRIIVELKKHFGKKLEREYFLTLSIISIDKRGRLKYSNAGHLPLLHYKRNEDKFYNINPKGIGIGFNDKGMFEKTLAEERVKTDTGDILCIYTDGITEAMNHAKIQFGESRLQTVIKQNATKSTEEIKSKILQSVSFFRGTAEINDDLSFVLLKMQ